MVLTGLNTENLIQSIELTRKLAPSATLPEGYEITDFSDRVIKFLFSTARLHKTWDNLHH
jgi:hypothetical protein